MPQETRTVQTKHSIPGFLDWISSPDAPGGAWLRGAGHAIAYLNPLPSWQINATLSGQRTLLGDIANAGAGLGAEAASFLTGQPVTYTVPFPDTSATDPIRIREEIALGKEPRYLAWVLANWDDIRSGKFTGSLNPEQVATIAAVEGIMQKGEDIPVYGVAFQRGATSLNQARVVDKEGYQRFAKAVQQPWPENIRPTSTASAAPASQVGNQAASPLEDYGTRREALHFSMALRDLAGHEALRRAEQELGKNPEQVAELYWNGAYRFAADAWGLTENQKTWLRQQIHQLAQEWAASGAAVPFQDYLRQRVLDHTRALTVPTQGQQPAQAAPATPPAQGGYGVNGY